jgi:hypothetical protein
MRHNRAKHGAAASAADVQALLLVLFVPHCGPTGAAFAYTVSMCRISGEFAGMTYRELVLLRADSETS